MIHTGLSWVLHCKKIIPLLFFYFQIQAQTKCPKRERNKNKVMRDTVLDTKIWERAALYHQTWQIKSPFLLDSFYWTLKLFITVSGGSLDVGDAIYIMRFLFVPFCFACFHFVASLTCLAPMTIGTLRCRDFASLLKGFYFSIFPFFNKPTL